MKNYNDLEAKFRHILNLTQVLEPGAPAPMRLISEFDDILDYFLGHPWLRARLDDRLKYLYRNPNRYFLDALESIEDNYELSDLMRVISQQDQDIQYLLHQLQHYDKIVDKYEKLLKKIDFLKRQNKRLLNRNNNLADRVYKSKDDR